MRLRIDVAYCREITVDRIQLYAYKCTYLYALHEMSLGTSDAMNVAPPRAALWHMRCRKSPQNVVGWRRPRKIWQSWSPGATIGRAVTTGRESTRQIKHRVGNCKKLQESSTLITLTNVRNQLLLGALYFAGRVLSFLNWFIVTAVGCLHRCRWCRKPNSYECVAYSLLDYW